MTNLEAIRIINSIGYSTPEEAEALHKSALILEEDVIPRELIEEAIAKMEETRDKDKLCEYPYNRCINILLEVLE